MATRRTLFLHRALGASLLLLPALFVAPAQAADMASVASQTVTQSRLNMPKSHPLEAATIGGLYHVDADRTPSGFAVPRFVSLKFGKVNARTGPSRNHSIAYQYQRRGLPVIVVAETEMWRKVRDISGDEAWVRKPALSGEKFAVLTTEATLYVKPDSSGRSIARIEQGALVQLEDCTLANYCRIRTGNGIKGFAAKHLLWGAQSID
ncbi:MAG: SH3 domain-containing protein [Litorimonas sp.]